MAEGRGHRKGVCATSTIGTLKASAVEVSVRKDLTIDQFEHTKLIHQNITLSVDSVAVEISGRTIVTAEEQAVIFD